MIYINLVENTNMMQLSGSGLDNRIINHLNKYFSYEEDGNKNNKREQYGYVPRVYLFDKKTLTIHKNFLFDLCRVLKANDYEYKVDKALKNLNKLEWVEENVKKFYEEDFINTFMPHKHQEKAIRMFLLKKSAFGEIATSGGKSFIIYVLACMLANMGKKILIITDTVMLVEQLKDDILSYTKNEKHWDKYIKAIHNKSKDNKHDKNAKIFISTYASMREDKEYFEQFDCLIVDEAHKAVASSVEAIINACTNAEYKFGMCGTLRGTAQHRLETTLLFGEVETIITARELIELGLATPLHIDMVALYHRRQEGKSLPKFRNYPDYVEFLTQDYKRMDYICDMAINENQNVILLFNRLKFGKAIYNTVVQRCEKKGEERIIEYIDGDVTVDERMRIKDLFINNNNVILVASYKTLSVGVNAPNLRAIMLVEPMKATITIVQSIGRVLRLNKGKKLAKVLDFWDNYGWGYTHAQERKKIYKKENHTWKEHRVDIEL